MSDNRTPDPNVDETAQSPETLGTPEGSAATTNGYDASVSATGSSSPSSVSTPPPPPGYDDSASAYGSTSPSSASTPPPPPGYDAPAYGSAAETAGAAAAASTPADAPAAEPAAGAGYGAAPAAPPARYATPAAEAAPAYGATPYTTQGYPAPSYGTQGYSGYGTQGYGTYAAAARTNVLAIVSLVASVSGFIILPFVGPLVGVITGHIGLAQIKRSGEKGRGLALAGVIVGWVSLAFIVVFIAIIVFSIVAVGASGSSYRY